MSRRNQGPKLRWFAVRGTFYITWTINGRSRKQSTRTASREEAENVFAEWLQLRRHRKGPSDPAQVLVTDILVDYITERGPKVIGQETMGRAVEVLALLLEGQTVADVPSSVDAYIKRRDRAPGTMRHELGVLQAAINHAHKRGRLTRSVALELPPAPRPRERWLTRQEAASLISASRTEKARLYLPLFILIGLYTGRRKEAILSLRWSQIDLEHGVIDFDLAGRAETKKRRGKAPIPDRLLPHLIRARRRGSDLGPVLHINGKPIQNIKKGFAAACRRAGIKGATPHTLRHTAATWLMQTGTPILEAARYLGMSEKTLTGTYGHHHPDWLRAAANAISGKRRAPRRGTGA
jgi:integrase